MPEPLSSAGYPARDCLVAAVNRDVDLRRFRDEAWYRIPDRALGRSVANTVLEDSNTLALYQTGRISDGLPGAIEIWGEIANVETLPRRDLIPDEPDHPAADQLYHRVRLARVHRLEHPILSRTPRRLVFLRTTREHLLAASDVNDLVIGSPAEERLWKELQKRRSEFDRKIFMEVGGTIMEVDFGLVAGVGGVAVLCGAESEINEADGVEMIHPWHVLRFSPGVVEQELEKCVEEIMAAARSIRQLLDGDN